MAHRMNRSNRVRPNDSIVLSAKKLGVILVNEGVITEDQMLQAFEYQNAHNSSLKDAIVKMSFASEDDVIGALVSNLGISFIGLEGYEISPDVLKVLSSEFCFKNRVIPVSLAGSTLTVAMTDPLDMVLIETLRGSTECEIIAAIAREREIEDALTRHYGQPAAPDLPPQPAAATVFSEEDAAQAVSREYNAQLANAELVQVDDGVSEQSAPIIRLSSQLVDDAYEKRASDIHIEPFETETIVRFRIDGVLHVHMRLPLGAIKALVSRYKIMADLDIAEHRLPQDGRIKFKTFSRKGTDVDLRVSTLPVSYGEKVVMRLLDQTTTVRGLDSMGFSPENLAMYRKLIRQPYGMILNVGPTGSGKTTTLYAALSELNSPERNIQTAEDPVEYMLKGINQTQMHHDIGLNFARALRAFLRQDPNVILVGEIRDVETASIAIEAALTGHLLFSTLHTNDAVGTVVRLIEMGIEPFLVSSSLLLVCAQRLIRRLCDCKQPDAPDEGERNALQANGIDPSDLKIYRARGCEKCGNSGYKGRLGAHEILTMTSQLHELVNKRVGDEELRNASVMGGMIPIFTDAMKKVAQGITSFEEAVRVVRER
jgi:type IV pilus assembly protein PilB